MPVNFRKIQQEYPDAIKLTVTLKPGAPQFSQDELKKITGEGKTLHFRSSGRSQTIIVSKKAAEEKEVENG